MAKCLNLIKKGSIGTIVEMDSSPHLGMHTAAKVSQPTWVMVLLWKKATWKMGCQVCQMFLKMSQICNSIGFGITNKYNGLTHLLSCSISIEFEWKLNKLK